MTRGFFCIGKHLISGEVAGRKNQKVISGGHNSDNFYDVLNSNGGKVIGNPTQVSKGIMDIKYQLPNGRVETKTVVVFKKLCHFLKLLKTGMMHYGNYI